MLYLGCQVYSLAVWAPVDPKLFAMFTGHPVSLFPVATFIQTDLPVTSPFFTGLPMGHISGDHYVAILINKPMDLFPVFCAISDA